MAWVIFLVISHWFVGTPMSKFEQLKIIIGFHSKKAAFKTNPFWKKGWIWILFFHPSVLLLQYLFDEE